MRRCGFGVSTSLTRSARCTVTLRSDQLHNQPKVGLIGIRNNSDAQALLVFMMDARDSHLEGAIQSLVWAIEEIAKTGNKEAEHHARLALEYLQGKARASEK
jgi:hypothetical protein